MTATALALESREGDRAIDHAILVACDLVAIDRPVLDRVRALLKGRLPGFDVRKLVVSATHTHTAPVYEEGRYLIPKDGVMQPAEYAEFLAGRIAEAAADAWKSRKAGRVGWGLGHAVVAQNRRAVYADGKAVMYGATDKADFRGIEGPEDQGVEVLFFWDGGGKLIATAVNVACPSQEVEGDSTIDADFWHEIRQALKAKHGEDLQVLGWTGAAGDQSPHLMYRKAAEERMRRLRKLSRLEELARRVVAAWEEAYEGARQEQHDDVALVHRVETVDLPLRVVTEEEVAGAREEVETHTPDPERRWTVAWYQDVIDRYDRQKAGKSEPYKMELHAIRLGDVAIATNPFELFTAVRHPDQGPEPGDADLRHPAGRARHLPADRRGGPRRRLQRDRGEQRRRPGRGPGAGGPDGRADQFALAGEVRRSGHRFSVDIRPSRRDRLPFFSRGATCTIGQEAAIVPRRVSTRSFPGAWTVSRTVDRAGNHESRARREAVGRPRARRRSSAPRRGATATSRAGATR